MHSFEKLLQENGLADGLLYPLVTLQPDTEIDPICRYEYA